MCCVYGGRDGPTEWVGKKHKEVSMSKYKTIKVCLVWSREVAATSTVNLGEV